MSDSVRPHRRQPTRLPRPWDSPGKNTGMGCHFLLQCMEVKSESEVTQSCPTLRSPMDCSPPGSSVHGIFQARVLEWVAISFSKVRFEESLKIEYKPSLICVWVVYLTVMLWHILIRVTRKWKKNYVVIFSMKNGFHYLILPKLLKRNKSICILSQSKIEVF